MVNLFLTILPALRDGSVRTIAGTFAWAVVLTLTLSPGVLSAAISQGYLSSEPLEPGTLVSIKPAKDSIEAADSTTGDGLLGAVVGEKAATLSINTSSKQLQVATSGSADVFVTDLNGAIEIGDQIAPSPIKGVGMKATSSGKVLGIVQGSFDGKDAIKTTTITSKSGHQQEAHIGVVPVAVQVTYYTVPVKGAVPAFLQQFADSIAGKPVSIARLAVIAVILTASIILVMVLLFSAVRGAIVSLGRNPLAKGSIFRAMAQVLAVSVVIMGIALAGVYVILSK